MKNPISKNFHEPLNSMSSVKTVQSSVARGGSFMVGNRYWMPPPRQFQPMFQVSANNHMGGGGGGDWGYLELGPKTPAMG